LRKESFFRPDLSSSNFNQIRTFFINPPASVFTFCKLGFMFWVDFFLVRFKFINANFLLELEWDSAMFFLSLGLVLLNGSLNCLVALLI
jgi:hypothetical protein